MHNKASRAKSVTSLSNLIQPFQDLSLKILVNLIIYFFIEALTNAHHKVAEGRIFTQKGNSGLKPRNSAALMLRVSFEWLFQASFILIKIKVAKQILILKLLMYSSCKNGEETPFKF